MDNNKPAPGPGGARGRAEIEAVLDRIARRIRELKAFDVSVVQDRWDQRLENTQKNFNKLVAEAFGTNSPEYRQHAMGPLDAGLDATFGDRYTQQEFHDEVRKALARAAARLGDISKILKERLEQPPGPAEAPKATAAPLVAATPAPTQPPTPAPTPAPTPPPMPAPTPASTPAPTPAPTFAATPAPTPTPRPTPAPMATSVPAASSGRTPRIAIVCRDDAAGEEVTTFIADLGLDPVISQPPGPGASFDVLEGLRQADFALVLQGDRQLEIGFLLAAVGRARMCVVQPEGGDDVLPGVAKFAMDEDGLWKLLLARHFKQAGLEVDLNKAM